jgi:uncharacterized membrane protein YidH (DUF202 family)
MDIIPTDALKIAETGIKIFFVLAAGVIITLNYFHTKEAKKMERKLDVALPGSIHLAMSVQFLLTIIFLFLATAFLFIA